MMTEPTQGYYVDLHKVQRILRALDDALTLTAPHPSQTMLKEAEKQICEEAQWIVPVTKS